MLAYCVRDLRLGPAVRIRWFKPEASAAWARLWHLRAKMSGRRPKVFQTNNPMTGQMRLFTDGEMRINVCVSPEVAALSVAHEAKHLADSMKFRPPVTAVEKAVWEQRAEDYERAAWRLYGEEINGSLERRSG